MPRERIQLVLDATANAVASVALQTPRPEGKVMSINSIEYDIGFGNAPTVIPPSAYIGLSPREMEAGITQVTQTVVLNNFSGKSLIDQMIKETLSSGAALEDVLSRSGAVVTPEGIYAINPTIFMGIATSHVAAGNPIFNALCIVDFDFVNLTNTVAVSIAEDCA